MPGAHDAIRGVEQINKVIRVDQQPLGNTPTSNPATYTGVFDLIRAAVRPTARGEAARLHGRGGSASTCPAAAARRAKATARCASRCTFCPTCGSSATRAAASATTPRRWPSRYHGQSIADVLDMSCGEAVELFENIPKIRRILQTLCDVGLDYLTLGQSAPTLSGGEAQRVKLAAELSRPDTGRTLYLLDEPTTGLHFDDLAKLLDVLNRLVDLGNTVVVIEHNLDVIKTADWVIDLGPEAGDDGGHVVACGTPEEIVEGGSGEGGRRKEETKARPSTSAFRLPHSSPTPPTRSRPSSPPGRIVERKPYDPAAAEAPREDDLEIDEVGRETRMPWEVDGRRWHTQDRVGRNGQPCRWDGRILDAIVDRIHELGEFADTNWNNRTSSKSPAPRNPTAGSSTPSPARSGC